MTLEVMALEGTIGQVEGDAAERLAALFDAHHRRLYSLACRMCRTREDARDCVQEAFLRAHPDLYERSHGAVRVRIANGNLQIGSLDRPGFASGAMPDWNQMRELRVQ